MNACLFVVADKNMEFALRGLLERDGWDRSIGCRRFGGWHIVTASGLADPGLYVRANVLLQTFRSSFDRVVVFIDAEWEGSPGAAEIKRAIHDHIVSAGWRADDGHCIVLEPEVDRLIWAWSPHVAAALGWPDMASIKSWLASKGLWPEDAAKPPRPKEALEECLREKRKPRSSALYRAICGKVSVQNCTDPAVRELRDVLCRWFPQDHSAG